MKQNFIHNPLLKRLAPIVALAFVLISISLSSIADPTESSSTAEKSNRVSRLLKRLREKDSKSKASVVKKQAQVAKPAKTEPKVKTKYKSTTKIKVAPVKISSEPAKEKQTTPRKKTSLIALNKFYIRADYGMGRPQNIKKTKNTMYGGGVGYKFNKAFRADINYQFRNFKVKNAYQKGTSATQNAVLANVYLNLMDESSHIIPFITAGAGYSINKYKKFSYVVSGNKTSTTGKNDGLTWNVGAGVMIRLTKYLNIDASYKYINLGNFKQETRFTGGTFGTGKFSRNYQVRAQEVTGGLIFNF